MILTERHFWETTWRNRAVWTKPRRLSYFHNHLQQLLLRYAPPQTTACEIGCGGSVWLPFLASHGITAWGIDYSAAGIALAQQHLQRAGVTATLVQADVFENDTLPNDFFDLIFSVGFVEHFHDTDVVLARLAAALRPDGVVVTLVPNLTGVWGAVQRRVDPAVYTLHVLYTPETLDAVHTHSGLAVVEPARHFGGFGPLVVNYTRLLRRLPRATAQAVVGTLWLAQQTVAWGATMFPHQGESRLLSSHVAGVYRRPS
jgi:2-polyprenyl-3-methyl-5-hydroxy-6-metoxy-1,4-benzoquinol methylase